VGSLGNLYNYYNNLKYFGNYTLNDINELFPFEREILMGLLKKTIKEVNKEK